MLDSLKLSSYISLTQFWHLLYGPESFFPRESSVNSSYLEGSDVFGLQEPSV